jgi:hypothetical protein
MSPITDGCREDIEQAISRAAANRDILPVAIIAKAIAARHGASPKEVADELTTVGIKAGVTMEFGSPDRPR